MPLYILRDLLPVAFALGCAVALVVLGDLAQHTWAAIGVLLAWGVGTVALGAPRAGVGTLLAAALGVRAVLLASPASLSDDLYRYLWEGKVVAMGGNPFVHAPADPHWAAFAQDPIRMAVNHPEVSTIYPPMALMMFGVLTSIAAHPLSIKLAMGLADALSAGVLAKILQGRGRALGAAWLYALHPLGAVESAGSGHMEPVALLCLLLAIWSWDRSRADAAGRSWGGVGWAGLGAMFKLMPGLLLPLLARRRPWLLVPVLLVGAATALPFYEAGPDLLRGLGTYAKTWAFNGPVYTLAAPLLQEWTRPALVLAGGGAVLWSLAHHRDPARLALWAGGAFVLLSPTVHPWYIAWAWLPALLCGVRAWTVWATLVPLSYAALASFDPASSQWVEPRWAVWAQVLPFGLALVFEWGRHRVLPGPWSPAKAHP